MIYLQQYRVKLNSAFSLKSIEPDDESEFDATKEADALELEKLAIKINAMQDILYAQGKRKILLILQGMDASGKNGTVRHVFSECDPLGIRITNLFAYL
jgi:polyphosphate kinase 2 (PPK2 family)